MMWWTELTPTERELVFDFGTFFAVTFLICGGAWTTEWWQRRRQRRR